jgi:N-methylhydantoinase A
MSAAIVDVGTDVGGTFTDLWAIVDDGRTTVVKSPTTPDIVSGIIDALHLAAETLDMDAADLCRGIRRFGHGTTVGLNALLTGNAARTAIITTAGFGDTLEIGRLRRQVSGLTESQVGDYFLRGQWAPLVPRDLVFEVPERIGPDGSVLTPLDERAAERLVDAIADASVQAVAICTLWASENPEHELALRALVAARLPDVTVSVSHEISPTVGEYARMSTTAANAALIPIASDYVRRLSGALRGAGVGVPPLLMTGAGGVLPADHLSARPVDALLSGPAAGVIACRALARTLGRRDVLTIDIGGTSFDVGLIVDGDPLMTPQVSFGGADIRIPNIDVASIGAGGGSIAAVRDGVLSVGPQSAGARPGPACYGRGGTEPTATDADVVLGVLDPEGFIGGRMRLDRDAAVEAIRTRIAEPMGISVMAAAWGIREVLDSRMADLLRRVTIERGHDPRGFVLFANGGAGPSHAWMLAREVGLDAFVVPAAATGLSAYGTGTSPLKATAERPVYLRIGPQRKPAPEQVAAFATAAGEAADAVRNGPLAELMGQGATVECTVAIRYKGQAHHLDVPVPGGATDAAVFAALIDAYEAQYERLFGAGAAFRQAGFEILYVRAAGTADAGEVPRPASGTKLRVAGVRDVVFDDPATPVATSVYRTEFPAAGQRVEGPCLVELPGHTAVVPPGARAVTDEHGNLHVSLDR